METSANRCTRRPLPEMSYCRRPRLHVPPAQTAIPRAGMNRDDTHPHCPSFLSGDTSRLPETSTSPDQAISLPYWLLLTGRAAITDDPIKAMETDSREPCLSLFKPLLTCATIAHLNNIPDIRPVLTDAFVKLLRTSKSLWCAWLVYL